MNKKGFTLVELLAVITIISLLVLLVLPKITGSVKNYSGKTDSLTTDLIKDAAKLYVSDHSDKYINKDGYKYCITLKELTDKDYLKAPVEYQDKDITNIKSIQISYNNGMDLTVVDSNKCIENRYLCKRATVLHEDKCSYDYKESCANNGYTLGEKITFGNLGTLGTLNSGDAFDCDVNGDGFYNSETERFYYVSDYYDGVTGEFNTSVATLIYYSNTEGINQNNKVAIAYDINKVNHNGPVTAKVNLPKKDKWKNVSLYKETRQIRDEKDSLKYGTINIASFSYVEYAARFITHQEIQTNCDTKNIHNTEKNCEYLLENTKYLDNSYLEGYWFESLNPHLVDGLPAINVVYGTHNNVLPLKTTSNVVGVRPAIDVPKEKLEI